MAPLFFLFAPLEPAYLIYKLVQMRRHDTNEDDSEKYPVFSWVREQLGR
jgi:hypothetical protein